MRTNYNFSKGTDAESVTVKKSGLKGVLLLLMLLGQHMTAQVSTYTFSQSNQTYFALSSPTVAFAAGWDDNAAMAVTIPFTFYFNGAPYTSVNINPNGFVTFGIDPGNITNPISHSNGTGAIAAFGRDLISGGPSGQIVYGIEGSAPNRVFVVQWSNAHRFSSEGNMVGDNLNFQIRLTETVYRAEIQYGTCTATSTLQVTGQVGLRGATNADFNNRTSLTSWASTTAGGANNAVVNSSNTLMPSSGLAFTYMPGACGVPSGVMAMATSATSANLSWTAPANAPNGGYQWEIRTSGSGGSGATGLTASGSTAAGVVTASTNTLTANTGYTLYVRANCSSNFSSWIQSSFSSLCSPTTPPYTQNFESATGQGIPSCTSIQNAGTGASWATISAPGWGFNSRTLDYFPNSTTNAANAWFYTQGIALTGGISYNVSYKYGNTTGVEKLKVAVGASAVATSMTTTLADHPSVTGGAAQTNVIVFTPASSGTYYFGFNAYSNADQYYLFLDDISIAAPTTPACSATYSPVNAAANVTRNSVLSWAVAPGATSYNVYFGTTPTPPLVLSNTTGSTYTPPVMAANTTYYWRVNPTNTIGTTTCAVNTFTTNSTLAYCIPTTTNGCNSGDHITNTTFTTINNNTASCLSASYSDYKSGTAGTVTTGGSYPISVSIANGGDEYGGAWIDWNQNATFDASEFITLADADNAAPWVYTATVNVPLNAAIGNTFLRVRSSYNAFVAANSSCSIYSYGETEDYRVNVIACAASTWYADPDNDGFGNPSVTLIACAQPAGYVSNNTDCNSSAITYADTDGDGYGSGPAVPCGVTNNTDCNPSNGLAYRSGTLYVDADHDGYTSGASAVLCYGAAVPIGYVASNTVIDCNDAVAAINPDHAEVPANGIDDNCNGQTDEAPVFFVPFSGSNTVSCGSNVTLYDNGGTGVYSHLADGYTVLQNATTGVIHISGSYDTEYGRDLLRLYSGAGTSGTIIGIFTGSGIIEYASAPGEVLTMQFTSDYSDARDGFQFAVTYTGECSINVPVVGTTTIPCGSNAIVNDDGGPSGNYANNANGTAVFQNAGTGIITLTGAYDIEPNVDNLVIYTGTPGNLIEQVGTFTGIGGGFSIVSPVGVSLTAVFTSNGSGTFYGGFVLQSSATGDCNAIICSGTPAPGNTVSSAAVACNGTTVNLSLENATPGVYVTYQWQQAASEAGPYADILDATASTYTATITSNSWYRANVACSGTATISNPVGITVTSGTNCVCTPAITIGCVVLMQRLVLNTLDNDSGINCAGNGLSDYTSNQSLTTTLEAGLQHNMTIYSGLYDFGIAAWIDFNDDGIFTEPSERITNSNDIMLAGTSQVYTITIPNAAIGQHRMRIRCEYYTGGLSITPCGQGLAGEAEDYTITITPPAVTWYGDTDQDGFGNPDATLIAATQPIGYVSNNTDCNDQALTYADTDGDGFGSGALVPCGVLNNTDCNDGDNSAFQTAIFYVDADNDGYTSGVTQTVCYGTSIPLGFVVSLTAIDCDDSVGAIHPNATEVPFNGVDDDCDSSIDETGTITTTLLASSCGTTLASIGSLIGIATVAGHPITGYRIRATNGAQAQVIEKTVPHFTMPQFPSYAYATTYTIEIQLQRAGIWQESWGAPCLVSTPAILENGGSGSINPSQCGITLAKISTLIATTSLQGVTGYRFRVTNLTDPLGPNAVQTLDRVQNWFSLQMLLRYNYGTVYKIEVAVKTTGTYGGFGAPCEVSSPAAPSLVNCSAVIVSGTAAVAATSMPGATQYRFQIMRDSDGASTTIDRNTNYFTFSMIPAATFTVGGLYLVRVAIMTTGMWSPFGNACAISAPGGTAKGILTGVANTTNKTFTATAYPAPFTTDFSIGITTSSKENIQLRVYDMLGKLIESKEVKLEDLYLEKVGAKYPSAVYNVIVSQAGIAKTLRVIKR